MENKINNQFNWLNKVVVKVYAKVLCQEVEYKTLSVTNQTTSKEVVRMLLSKFRLKHRDPNLFYLTMEVWIRQAGIPIRSVIALNDEACPAQLQACYPQKDLKFSLMMTRGGLVKVYDSCLMSGSLYKSLLLSDRTTVDELIQLLLHCYNSSERASKFSLYEICLSGKYERKLHGDDMPLQVQADWPNPDLFVFQLRINSEDAVPKRKVPWTRVLDPLGNITFRLNGRDEVNPNFIHSPTLKPSFNNYQSSFYI